MTPKTQKRLNEIADEIEKLRQEIDTFWKREKRGFSSMPLEWRRSPESDDANEFLGRLKGTEEFLWEAGNCLTAGASSMRTKTRTIP